MADKRCKLTAEQVKAIRAERKQGKSWREGNNGKG
jgi:hypothetical protein